MATISSSETYAKGRILMYIDVTRVFFNNVKENLL